MRALLRLLRWPTLAGAVFAAVSILVGATAVAPLFLAKAGAAIFESYASEQGPEGAVTIANDGALIPDVARYRDNLMTESMPAGLGDPTSTMIGDQAQAAGPKGAFFARPVYRSGAFEEIRRLTGGPAEGVWISSFLADRTGAGPGDTLSFDDDPRVEIEVAGVYRDLLDLPLSEYWSALDTLVYPPPTVDVRPPDLLVVDRATFFEIEGAAGVFYGESRWEYPVDAANMTLEDAEAVARDSAAWGATLHDPATELGSALGSSNFVSLVGGWADLAGAATTAISGPVDMLSFGGRAVAFLVIAGAGFFTVRRRRTEFMLFHARGIGPLRLGLAAAVEALLPAVAGAAAGGAIALAFLEIAGPEGPLAQSAVADAARDGAWMTGAALLLYGISAAAAVRVQAHEGFGRLGRSAARVPWELVVLALAAASLYELLTRGLTPVEGDVAAVPRLDRLVILFPILVLTGAGGLAGRALKAGLPRLRAAGRNWSPAPYIASRRLASSGRAATALVTATSVAAGIFAYAAIVSASAGATAAQRSLLRVGSDVAANVGEPPRVIDTPGFNNTPVVRYSGARLSPGPGDPVSVIAIDPDTFAGVAYWESQFSEEPLEELLARIGDTGSAEVPTIIAGELPGGSLLQISSSEVPVKIVGRTKTFPGVLESQPLVVVGMKPLSEALVAEDASLRIGDVAFQIWADGSRAEMNAALAENDESVHSILSAAELRDTPPFLALTWTFSLLEALGVLIGLVALVGMFMYLQTRQGEQQVSYALSARMGLRRTAHRASVGIEMTALLGASALLGLFLAVVVALPTNDHIQVFSDPGSVTLLQIPAAILAVAVGTAIAAGWVAAWFVQRQADRADIAQVMRLAR